jgi:hypothetical protein
MAKCSPKPRINNTTGSPAIGGHLEISKRRTGVFIGGDPEALRSLARLLNWLADVDQESLATMPDGERCHVHLESQGPVASLSAFSNDTEICRLDAKGTGDFPQRYCDARRKKATKCTRRQQSAVALVGHRKSRRKEGESKQIRHRQK